MSRCGRTQSMEAVALGELSGPRAEELRAHARECPLCRHELNWLETEATLFRHRAGRDQVAELWAGVASSRGLTASAGRPWQRVLAGMAAGLVLLVGAGRVVSSTRPPSVAERAAAEQEALESEALMSPVLFTATSEACSRLPSGTGFRCEPVVPASFLAAR